MKLLSCPILALALLLGDQIGQAAVVPSAPSSEPVSNKLEFPLHEYALSWSAAGQQSYQVLVASSEARLAVEVGDVWDSGRREGADGQNVLCRGRALNDGETVWWKVRIWDSANKVGEWSAPQKIEVPEGADNAKRVSRPGGSQGDKLEFVKGRMGKAIRLGEGRAVVWSDDYEGLRSSKGVTIMAWIKPAKASDSWQCILRKEDGSDRRVLAIGREGDFWGVWGGFGIGGKYCEFGAPYQQSKLLDGGWHHVAVTFDGVHLRLFVDGKKIGEKEQRGVLGGNGKARAYIGSNSGESEVFEGAIDELEVYSSALSEKQISEYVSGILNGGFQIPVGHWKFEGDVRNEVTTVRDPAPHRVALLGGTMISRMDQHGYFENAVTAHWPHHDISFRNLGWPADDVFGTARSEFGSAHNTRSWQPPKGERGFGFEKLKRQLAEAQPSAIIVGYGAEAAFADTEEKMKQFEAGYRALIAELEQNGASLVLLTPVLQAKHGQVLPDVSRRNERLRKAGRFIKALAKAREHLGIDCLEEGNPFKDDAVNGDRHPCYENGVHLSELGYRRLAYRLAVGLGAEAPSDWRPVTNKGRLPRAGRGVRENLEQTKLGLRYDFTRDRLPAVLHDDAIATPRKSDPRIWIDGEEVSLDNKYGVILSGSDFEQSEKLRQVIIEKNKLHRYKLNPINKAYIFLFRRHEMGHLAYELEDFDELVAGREQAIANLRVPRRHRYEVEHHREWKSPRDYPDHEVPKNIPAPDIAAELKAFTMPDEFQVTLFAKNPMIFNPINLNWDRHGRAWVATSSTYPHIKPGRIPNDRIVILEDTDEDGVADKSTVFAEGLTVPHSVMPVKGGAYVCSTTEVLFLADHDGDDVADERRVLYSGFGNADVHHMIHGLRWSPWGDLFFTQSIYINSFVETAHGPRRLNGSGIWRFRPESERLDVFARGMVNPWGLAFDSWGDGFGTDGAGGSGPHDVFPGSAFRSAVGAPRVLNGLIGGKPKNTAAEFMSGRHIPPHWQGSLLANDFRANRTVRYELEASGSGFKAKEVETVLHSSHRSFRPVDIKMGPEGAIYIVDWYNPIIDHGEVDFHHPSRDKSHGRIWRMTVRDRTLPPRPKIAEATNGELLDHLKSPEQYTRTQANRELVSRGISGAVVDAYVNNLDPKDPDFDHHRLEGLWLYTALNEKPLESIQQLTKVSNPRVRAAAVRVAGRSAAGLPDLAIAVEDEHPRVRLEAVSALRMLGSKDAADIALRALDYEVDTNLDFALEMTVRDTRDQWLPALQAGKTVFDGKASRLSYALSKVNDPRAIGALADVIAGGKLSKEDMGNAISTVAALGTPEQVGALLVFVGKSHHLLPALARGAEFNQRPPVGKEKVSAFLDSSIATVRIAAASLCGAWQLSEAKGKLRSAALKSKDTRESLAMCHAMAKVGAVEELTALAESEGPALLRATAVAALAGVQPAKTAVDAAKVLSGMTDPLLARFVFESFLSREEGPVVLAKVLGAVKLPEAIAVEGSRTVSASGRNVPELLAALNKAGGLKPLAANLGAAERQSLIREANQQGDAGRGQKVYERASMVCTTCHLVNGKGGKLGPDLSTVGSYMTPESILESLLNPSTDIKQGYETVLVTKKDQTLVSGLLQRKTDTSVLVRDPSGTVVSIPSGEIAKMDTSPVSLMPPGLTASLRRDELVDLMRYLTTLGGDPVRDGIERPLPKIEEK